MLRPDNMARYPDVDLKLGIKSALPDTKATLGLLMMIWRASNSPAELTYSKQVGDTLEVADDIAALLTVKYHSVYSAAGITDEQFLERVNNNQLLKSQLESLIVAFELVWRVAKVKFVGNMANSFERTGGKRYDKRLLFTKNMDILDTLLSSDDEQYSRVLLSWIGFNTVGAGARFDTVLLQLLVILSEEAVYKLADGERDIVFNMNSVYAKLLTGGEAVDINDTHEAKGPLRILKSALSDRMNPLLSYSNTQGVSIAEGKDDQLAAYQKRVDTYLSLTNAKHIIATEPQIEVDGETPAPEAGTGEVPRIVGGKNVILYGVPGAGKSYTVGEEYCNDENRMERLVFHPDYTNSDFVGQILPNVTEGNVSYEFTPGPFTRLLDKAYKNPGEEFYLIVEEINRGNAPAIFGEVFQLLDRGDSGESEYGISNANIARIVYGDETRKVRIPSNMSIIGTMNTSDQNVFTLDTAFQRRWSMRMIENDLGRVAYAETKILDTDVTWRRFNTAMNSIILKKNVRVTSSEDKRLGAFFVREIDLRYDAKETDGAATPEEKRMASRQNRRFPEKVLKYLWDDAFKFSREDVFETGQYISLEEIVRKFRDSQGNARFSVFKEDVVSALLTADEE
ncbi:McrB family protein [Dehalococcoides mccartyi]|uniref:McrB family protein n=1 Tax=Dehalococcoides mccartyi TaxID=61435 RepID=UPI0008711231|nr:AAA family ATPase [Dehalococcoides mccartyi]AOV98904.1 McrBC restriction endonuclease system [Dehalococcoides mccartyi]